ncbi:hypothetical protein IW139_004679 [Coemansia sp. RSA 353]|nr:hypothetical protein EV181_004870 [Coemansia sp. RSA 532]KAJ2291381.1 hypothetical protein IW139_004679 [Coemansia sp. RSA 353]
MAPKADDNSGAVFDELLVYYESKISALRQTRDSLEQTKPAVTPPESPDSSAEPTRALLALELYQEMIEDMTMGVVFEAHYEDRQLTGICALCNTKCQCGGAGLDAAAGTQAGADMFECPSCQRSFPAARFAAHMDKCMGLSSRRAATRRSAANSASSTPAHAAGYESSSSTEQRNRKSRPSKRARRGGADLGQRNGEALGKRSQRE